MKSEWLHMMDDDGRTPLDRAFSSGHMVLAEMMLRQEKQDQNEALSGCTPLHRASYLGLTAAVRSLLTYGSDPKAADEQGELPLHKAARQGHLETVRVLAECSNVNAVSAEGMAPIHWASLTGRVDVVQVLLDNGADVNQRNESLDGLTGYDLANLMGYSEMSRARAGSVAAA